MNFLADLHVHSKFSRATARNLDLEHLYIAAQWKGLTVVGTGDFTHPAWYAEIREKLIPFEDGLFVLHPDIAKSCDEQVPPACRRPVRFILVSEISNIYKKDGKTRKNHNLVFCPDFHRADQFRKKLGSIGNVESDGRPILGLDARDLLEIVLTVSEDNYLIPAHIWTPWFSLLGSKSGFDSVDACFDDLSDRIFALETGLSSDPSMNRRVSQLDRYALVSNSDAHSPIKLGRECNRFCGEPGFGFIRQAIESNDPDTFKGTVEFYPEEGKYHYDGHRKCHLCFDPDQTRSHSGICPKCGKPLTLGVLYRVEELADRKENDATEGDPPFHSLIPLQDILSELLSVGPGTKTVLKTYHSLLDRLGCEYDILLTMAPDALDRTGVPLLGEAIRRMRVGDIVISPGYDGEFGKVRIFEEGEKKRLLGQTGLFPKSEAKPKKPAASARDIAVPFFEPARPASQDSRETVPTQDPCLNKSQQQAVESRRQHILIIAGPGTGKTRTLTHRIAYIIESREVNAETLLAVTFTTKAAAEMRERLMSLLGTHSTMPTIGTFHALGHQILSEVQPTPVHVIDDSDRLELVSEAVADVGITVIRKTDLLHRIVTAKQRLRSVHDDLQDIAGPVESNAFTRVYARYQELLEILGVFDFEDLIAHSIAVLETEGAFRDRFRNRFCHLFIDEYQDLNFSQYRMIKALYGQGAPHRSICAIGDPNQSIYGFRGSETIYFQQFQKDFPKAEVTHLQRNYRSTETILSASQQIISHLSSKGSENRVYSSIQGVPYVGIMENPTEAAEAVAVGKMIEQMVGGTGFHAIDFNAVDSTTETDLGFSDFAVLFRTGAQSAVYEDVFSKAGIPYQTARRDPLLKRTGYRQVVSCLKLIYGCGTYSDLIRWCDVFDIPVSESQLASFRSWGLTQRLNVHKALEEVGSRSGVDPKIGELGGVLSQHVDRLRSDVGGLEMDEQIARFMELGNIPLETDADACLSDMMTVIAATGSVNGIGVLSRLALKTDADLVNRRSQKVLLMSMHAAKGLEFPVVFISGCEAGLIPYAPSGHQSVDPDEERRMFYVAMTRAQSHLFLTWSKQRRIYGRRRHQKRSPFVENIDEHLTRAFVPLEGKHQQPKPAQLGLFVE